MTPDEILVALQPRRSPKYKTHCASSCGRLAQSSRRCPGWIDLPCGRLLCKKHWKRDGMCLGCEIAAK